MTINHKNITLRQLWAFDMAASTLNFTQAADNLHMSQSSLSGLIKELENTLECKLFDRTTRQLALSEAGEQIRPMVGRVLRDVRGIANELTHLKDLDKGTVRVAASQQLAAAILPKIIAKFEAMHPNVTVLVEDCSVEQVIGMVNAGVVDFGIAPHRQAGQGVVSEKLLSLPFYVAMPSTHPLATKRAVDWQELTGERLIILGGAFATKLAEELPPAESELIKNASRHVNFMSTAFAMCGQGLGLAICLPYSKERVRQNDLIMIPLTNPQITRSSHLYRKQGRSGSHAAERFYAELCRQLQILHEGDWQ